MSHGIEAILDQLSPQDQFKVVFLEKCAEQGLSALEILQRVKTAQDRVKQAGPFAEVIEAIGGGLKGLSNYAIPAAFAAPPIIGGLLGHGYAKMQEPTEDTIESIQQGEIADEYKKQTQRLKREQALKKYREQNSGRGGRPML
jgi:hypothetical protein